jgi:hypothetical protein
MKTEAEARSKWCPEVGAMGITCLASDCMMWRWYRHDLQSETLSSGYCGIAGMKGCLLKEDVV